MYTLVCTFSVILSHRLHRLRLLLYLFSWTTPLPHLALIAWLEKDPFFNQSKSSAGCGLVLMLVRLWFDPWTFWEPACFSTGTRATVVSHSSITVYVSNFPALPGSTMPAHFNSLQVLLLALLAYIGIQCLDHCCYDLGSIVTIVCSFSGGYVRTRYSSSSWS